MDIHQKLSVKFFNEVWALLEKPERSVSDDRLMRETAHASLFHWLKREDCSDSNLSIGFWQVARVHAVLGESETARHYARECVEISSDLPPFYLGYAYEAMARAAMAAGRAEEQQKYHQLASEQLARVEAKEDRELLENDLRELA